MHEFAFSCLLASMLITVFCGLLACQQVLAGKTKFLPWIEKGQAGTGLLFIICSAVLLNALAVRDFSFVYVHDYTDTFLPMFYALTAFWAGQAGSFLFWTLTIVLMGTVMPFTPAYKALETRTRLLFWLFFSLAQAFFIFMLVGPSNPFMEMSPAPLQGNGLNPLLQNPGMIFHPPLLFIGYAGFTIPCCLAFAGVLSGQGLKWLDSSRNWLLFSWLFLTAGIVLGAWWSYMELGWGGYWAWDPVENASLIPWLAASAFLHSALLGRTKRVLARTNIVLAGTVFNLCLFGTFVVRSGYIDSLHAFGSGGVGFPLLTGMIVTQVMTMVVAFSCGSDGRRHVDDFFSRQGMIVLLVWLLAALSTIVFFGILWPVFSKLWSSATVGLDAGFYNRVCLPVFTLLSLVLGVCPWLSWKSGWAHPKAASLGGGVFLGIGIVLWVMGMHKPLALVAAAAAVLIIFTIIALFVTDRSARVNRRAWGAHGVHLGLALMVLGIAFSGPYQQEKEILLPSGGTVQFGGYEFLYRAFDIRQTDAMQVYEAELMVARDGEPVGILKPQKRIYANFDQSFAEVSVIPSLLNEIYATLLAFDEDKNISIKVSINPLVNWIWIGGTLMCLALFFSFSYSRKKQR